MKLTKKYLEKKNYRELSDQEKNIKREYGRNKNHNMSKEKKTLRISKELS